MQTTNKTGDKIGGGRFKVARLGATALSLLLVAACATAVGTGYQPADGRGYGYSETRIEADRYRVTFAGDGATPPETVEALALRRAAELGLSGGFDWFRIVSGGTDRSERGGVNVGAGLGTGSFGRRGGVNVGVGGNVGRVGARAFYTSRLEVIYGRGETPDEPDAYDIASVLESTALVAGFVGEGL